MNEEIRIKLITAIENDINYNNSLSTTVLVDTMTSQLAYRENYILENFDSVEIDGNLLHIYSTDDNGFTVGYNAQRLGDIVG